MAVSLALKMTKWMLDLASQVMRARVRLHNVDVVSQDMSIIFAANHFTRLETLLLPYIIHKHTGLEPWSLAAAELFTGRIGNYLRATGSISTKDPDRDKTIIRALLRGDHPWVIFPEGAMIKDKHLLQEHGLFRVFDGHQQRPPHTGAASLALRAAYYRAKLRCLHKSGSQHELEQALKLFDLNDYGEVAALRTVIIPVNITYYPIRARDNIFLRGARKIGSDLSQRAFDELSVEGTVLAEDTDIDVTFGNPIAVDEYLASPEYAPMMTCTSGDLTAFEGDTRAFFHDLAQAITHRFMASIYAMTMINIDHIFAGIIRRQTEGRWFCERDYRERIYLCAQQVLRSACNVHPELEKQCDTLLDDEPHAAFQGFLDMAVQEKFLISSEYGYKKKRRKLMPLTDYHAMPREATPDVIANESEAAWAAPAIVRYIGRTPDFIVKTAVSRHLEHRVMCEFEEDYARFYLPAMSKAPCVGRPFLLKPWRVRGGVVLAHGYMAAPLEVRALAEHLYHCGFAVYGIRLKGHGTAPEDLARCDWEDWYASFSRGYAMMRSITDNVVLGGFSTGGCLALMGAAKKKSQIKSVFSICAPLHVRNYSIRLVPSIISLNALLKKFGQSQYAWDYVENNPENKHINYTRNPLTGVQQLTQVMNATEGALGNVQTPTLVIQGSKDDTVDPVSGSEIFEKLGTRRKQLVIFERERHGIINGEGSPEVFSQVEQFLCRTLKQEQAHRYWLFGRRVASWFSGLLGHENTRGSGVEEPYLSEEELSASEKRQGKQLTH
jgi:esterase/lipase/1-acyl-sn-glycerol-3-phosphate acyltransferase